MTLRGYRPADAVAMYRLDRRCFEEAFRFSLRAMRRFAEAPRALCVVAECAGELAGFAIADRDGEGLYLVTLDVAEPYRRAGLAQRMLEWLEERAEGVRWVILHVFAENGGAIAFYERTGFVAVGREIDFYGRGMDALVYQRAMTPGASSLRD